LIKIKTLTGFVWAVLVILAIPAVFMSNNKLAEKLVHASGMKISPVFTGGEINDTIENKGYETIINKPVFACLAGETKKGFIQVEWRAKDKLPPAIEEKIDINGDKIPEFTITFDTASKKAAIINDTGTAAYIIKVYTLKTGFAVRAGFKKLTASK
jgi:hypothetical protein